jgi:hypothetical protein
MVNMSSNILSLGNIAVISDNESIKIYKYKEGNINEKLDKLLQYLNSLIMNEPFINCLNVNPYKIFESPDYVIEETQEYWSIRKKVRGSTVLKEWGVIPLDFDGRVKLINKIKSSFIDEK